MAVITLGAINNPNVYGTGCNIVEQQINLPAPASSGLGLPNAVSGFMRQLLPKDSLICDQFILKLENLPINTKYLWSTGSTTNSTIVNQSGKYWVQIETPEGCTYSDTINTSGNSLPPFTLGKDTLLCLGSTLLLDASGYGDSYTWQDQSTSPILLVTAPGSYFVELTDNGCVKSDTINISYSSKPCQLKLPNAFTPAKKSNNIFRLSNAFAVKEFKMNIYNRWGQLVFQTNDPSLGWNGMSKGVMQPAGTYVYMLSYFNLLSSRVETQKGTVVLIL